MLIAHHPINKGVVSFIRAVLEDKDIPIVNTNFSKLNASIDAERIEFWFGSTKKTDNKTVSKSDYNSTDLLMTDENIFKTELAIRVVSEPVKAMEYSSKLTSHLLNSLWVQEYLPTVSIQESTLLHNQFKYDNKGIVVSINTVTVMLTYVEETTLQVPTFDTVEVDVNLDADGTTETSNLVIPEDTVLISRVNKR